MEKKEKYEGYLSSLYNHNEIFILVSAGLFITSLIAGYFLSGFLDQILGVVLNDLKRRVSEGELELNTLNIFFNNLKIAFFIYAGGLFVGIGTVFYLVTNGLFIGYAGSKFPFWDFIVFTIPHGIIEVLGIIIAGAAGFRLAITLINILDGALHIRREIPLQSQLEYILKSNMDSFKESLALFLIAVVLILIAAVIEANITISWGRYIQSIT